MFEMIEFNDGFSVIETGFYGANRGWLPRADGWTRQLAEQAARLMNELQPVRCDCECECTGCGGTGCDGCDCD